MTKYTPGPYTVSRYGIIGFEIQGSGKSIAVVNRVQNKRLAMLNEVRSTKAKRGEQAYQAEQEAAALEASTAEAKATAELFAASDKLLEACEAVLEGSTSAPRLIRAAIAAAKGGAP